MFGVIVVMPHPVSIRRRLRAPRCTSRSISASTVAACSNSPRAEAEPRRWPHRGLFPSEEPRRSPSPPRDKIDRTVGKVMKSHSKTRYYPKEERVDSGFAGAAVDGSTDSDNPSGHSQPGPHGQQPVTFPAYGDLLKAREYASIRIVGTHWSGARHHAP